MDAPRRAAPMKPWERSGGGTTSTPIRPAITSPSTTTGVSSLPSSSSSSALTPPSSTTSALTPRTPARPWDSSRPGYDSGYGSSALSGGYGSSYGSSYGNSGYGGYGGRDTYSRSYGGYGSSSYGSGYGSSYGSGYGGGYGSSYGSGYGSSYGSGYGGGYGSGYGGGYGGGYGPYGGGFNDPKSPYFNAVQGSQSFFGSLQYFVDAFGRFSRLLDANYDAMHGSFTSVIRLVEHMGRLNTEVMMVIKTFTVFRLLQSIVSRVTKLLRFLLGRSTENKSSSALLSVKDFQQFSNPNSTALTNSLHHSQSNMPPPPSNWRRTLLIVTVAFFGLPVILGKLVDFLAKSRHGENWEQQWNNADGGEQARAMYDFVAESNRDLEFKKGDTLRIINKPHPEWWEAELNGKVGLIPRNYVELERPGSPPHPDHDKQITPFH